MMLRMFPITLIIKAILVLLSPSQYCLQAKNNDTGIMEKINTSKNGTANNTTSSGCCMYFKSPDDENKNKKQRIATPTFKKSEFLKSEAFFSKSFFSFAEETRGVVA